MKPGDKVRCITGYPQVLHEDTVYEVLLVVNDGADVYGSTKGIVVRPERSAGFTYPYVWSVDRFIPE